MKIGRAKMHARRRSGPLGFGEHAQAGRQRHGRSGASGYGEVTRFARPRQRSRRRHPAPSSARPPCIPAFHPASLFRPRISRACRSFPRCCAGVHLQRQRTARSESRSAPAREPALGVSHFSSLSLARSSLAASSACLPACLQGSAARVCKFRLHSRNICITVQGSYSLCGADSARGTRSIFLAEVGRPPVCRYE